MVAESSRRRATYADLEAVPENLVAEILDGELVVSPRPARPHTNAASNLGILLGSAFRFGVGGPGGWVILDEPELHLGPDVLVPDLAGWRRERMNDAGAVTAAAYYDTVPDWACEVLSPWTARTDRARKLPIYARERVPHVWLVDPVLQTVEVLRLDGVTFRIVATHEGVAKVRAEPFEALELDLGSLWS